MASQTKLTFGKENPDHPMRFWRAGCTFGNGSVGFYTRQETAPGLVLFYDGSDAEMVE